MSIMKRFVIVAALAMTLAPTPALAQVDRATLSGTVKDSAGAVLPGATVSITNTATQVAAQQQTTSTGSYLFVNLIPGQYDVSFELTGFKKDSRRVTLDVGQRARLDAALQVGAISETVQVSGSTQLLNSSEATLGGVISQSQISNLPLAIRNWDDLLALVPGVEQDRYTEQGGGTSFGRTGGINVHGSRALQNDFLLDGVDNNSISENVQELTSQVSRPSVDAIQEFKVITTPYSAEYGRSPGAAVSVTTKSGTNTFHGTAYEYFRNQAMDTIDYFSKKAGAAKPADLQNQPGGNLGGPIVRNKAFFFADFEGTRITRGQTRLTNVPTLDQRNGIFTTTIKDPTTGLPFPNNTIPSNMIDPYAAAILALLPAPNEPGASNFFRTGNLTDDSDRLVTRGDWRPTAADSIFARYIRSTRQRDIPGAFGGVLDGTGTSAYGNESIKTNGLVGGWTRVLSNVMVNEARFSWEQATSDAAQQPFGLMPPANTQIPGMITNPLVAGGFPGISVTGFFGGSGLGRIGSPDFLPKFQHTNEFEYIDTLSWLHGNHALKFGGNIIAPMTDHFLDVPAMRGSFTFSGGFTGNGLADFLLGDVSGFQLSNVDVTNQRHWATMGYAQDDWKASDRLTLTLGLRYDFMTPALEADNHETNFNPAGAGSLVFAGSGSLEDRTLVKPDRNNFAPRVGFVYKINEQTLVRGGWGIFYNVFDRVGSEDQLSLNLPNLINTSLSRTSGTPLFLFQQGIPVGFLTPPSLDPTQGQLTSIHVRAVDANDPDTSLQQASIGMQREFAGIVASADFVYTRGSNLATLVNLNQPLPNAPGANNALGPLPYPNFGFIEWRADDGKSQYAGVDVGVEKRFDKGYSFGVAYTYGNSQDNASEQLTTQGSNAFPQNSRDFTNWYGPSDYDVRHRLTTNFVLDLPFGQNILARDWVVSGVYAVRSGRPFTVNQSNNNVGQSMYGLPNVSGDPSGPQTVAEWFNVAAFTGVPSGIFGDEVRNQLRGPGFQSFDLSLQRMIRFGARYNASLRWDVFNLFNATNLGLPNKDVSSPSTLGTITSLAGDPRIMQLSVRFTF
ncbi:MAG: TonB-dependent receptor [Vicinamibacterales bacterium]